MRTIIRRIMGSAFALSLVLLPAACSDEDGDGAASDEGDNLRPPPVF